MRPLRPFIDPYLGCKIFLAAWIDGTVLLPEHIARGSTLLVAAIGINKSLLQPLHAGIVFAGSHHVAQGVGIHQWVIAADLQDDIALAPLGIQRIALKGTHISQPLGLVHSEQVKNLFA